MCHGTYIKYPLPSHRMELMFEHDDSSIPVIYYLLLTITNVVDGQRFAVALFIAGHPCTRKLISCKKQFRKPQPQYTHDTENVTGCRSRSVVKNLVVIFFCTP